MNKAIIAGSIIATIIVISTISALSYKDDKTHNETTTAEDTESSSTTAEPEEPKGKHFTIELNESIGITSNP